MKRMKIWVLACALLAKNISEAQTVRKMTLKDCMEYAISNSTQMRLQQADRDDERIARRDAILSAFTPSIQGSTYAYNYYGRNIDPETNTFVNTTSFNNGYSLSGGIMLFNGFQAINNLKISKTMMEMGLSKDQQAKDGICLTTMEAFYNAVYYAEMVKTMQIQVEAAEKSLALAQKQESLGQKGHADVVQMEADLADRRFQLIDMQNLYSDAMISLKDVMFWPVDEDFEIDCAVDDETILELENDNPNSIISFAKASNVDALIAKGTMDRSKLEWRTAKWQLLPSLSLNGGWSTSYYTYPNQPDYVSTPFFDQLRNNSGEYLQVSLNIPIFDRLSAHSNIARRKNEFRRAEAEYNQTMKNIENEVCRAIQDKNGAWAALLQADQLEKVQEEAFALNAKRLEQGLISSIEYQTASAKYLEAKANRLYALLKYYMKCSVVKYYKGVSYVEQF